MLKSELIYTNSMNEMNPEAQWPPTHLAVLQNGDGNPEYYRPRQAGESENKFIQRIAGIVVRDIVRNPYTSFVNIVEGATGEPDKALAALVVESMRQQEIARQT